MFNQEAFDLLSAVSISSESLQLQHFPDMHINYSAVDQGIRDSLKSAKQLYSELARSIFSLNTGEILVLMDSFQLNYVFALDDNTPTGFYCVGPYRSVPYEQTDFDAIARELHINYSGVLNMQTLLRQVPSSISEIHALAFMYNILLYFHGIKDPKIRRSSLISTDTKQVTGPAENIQSRVKRIDEIYMHEDRLAGFIRDGNDMQALKEANFFRNANLSSREQYSTVQSNRSYMLAANTMFRAACRKEGVLPFYLDEISQKYARKLTACITTQQATAVYIDMIHAYCQLAREHATAGHSQEVQNMMQYVLTHLDEDLTVEKIASCVNRTPNYASHLFKAQTGSTILAYITNQRVRIAKRVLEESQMSVQEIAIYVGIPDWNYFTKVFRKNTGMTPSEYRRKHSLL